MRTTTLTLCALLLPAAADARPMVWWHMSDGPVEEVPDHIEQLGDERAMVAEAEVAVDRRQLAIDQRKEARTSARAMRRQARKDLRDARRDVRQADRDDHIAMRVAIDDEALAERQLMEAHDLVDLQTARIRAAREQRRLAASRLSRAIAQREYAEAFLVSVNDTKGEDWTVPNRYLRQRVRMQDEVLDDERGWAKARAELREASQDHWAWDDADVFASFYQVPVIDEVVVHPREPELKRLHFELGRHHVMAQDKPDLIHNALVLRDHRDVTVRIEGHTDASGPAADNLDLAWDRAEAVAASLRQMGVWDSQIETVAFGEGRPLVDTDDATTLNRRVELRVLEPDTDAVVEGTVEGRDGYEFSDEPMDGMN